MTFVIVTLSSTVISLMGGVALVPLYGATGAGVATATGVALFNLASVIVVRRVLGVWPYNRQYLKPLAAGGLAAAVILLSKALLTPPEGLFTVLVLGPLFLLTYAVLNLILGLNPSDRKFLESLWAAIRRRTRRGA